MVKALRVLSYYVRLIRYAATAEAKLFHLLWNNKFEFFDRTLLMLYYKFLGKRVQRLLVEPAFTENSIRLERPYFRPYQRNEK
jgi:hypothetical protein